MADTDTTTVDPGYDTGDYREQSVYQDYMQAPIIYENAVDDSRTNGICVLSDFKTCKTTWNADNVPTNQTIYPRHGKFIKEIKPQRVLYADVNGEITHQPFRIADIAWSEDEIVVNSTHIIGEYLANNPLLNPTNGTTIGGANWTAQMCGNAILNSLVRPVPALNFDSDVSKVANVSLDVSSANALNLFIDPDQQGDEPGNSVLAKFGGHFIFDGTTIYHRANPGKDRNITIKYGKKGGFTSDTEEKNIAETPIAIYPIVTYTPPALQATKSNIDWNALITQTNWTSVGSVTYSAAGSVDVYDCPVKGNQVIRQLTTGTQLKLGPALSDGTTLKTIDGKTAQVSTVNGDQWYPIAPEDGGGWIDGNFVNFSKNGDYLINDVVGHVTVDAKGTDTKLQRYPISGYATVTYTQGKRIIHGYFAPDQSNGPNGSGTHVRNGKTYKNGQRVHYDYYAVDENGKGWYRISPHNWLYGPHLSIDKNHDVQTYPSQGYGYVKKTAKKYYINKKKGTVTEAKHHLSLAQAKKQHKPKYKYVWRGKGKKRKRIPIPNPDYQVGKPIKQKAGYHSLNYGQVVIAGVTYYKLSNGSYVKKSDIDKKARKTQLPQTPEKIVGSVADKKGKIEMYGSPSKGAAMNWSIPDGTKFSISHSAEGADGKTWYEVTYGNLTGWIPAESTSTSAPDDMEPTAPETDDPYNTDTDTQPVSDNTVTVQLDDDVDKNIYNHALYAEGMYDSENTHILKLDLSDKFQHDPEDQDGLQDDGTWIATDKDKQQLYELVKGEMDVYDIGKFPISIQAEYSHLGGSKDDLLALSMYDYVNIDFTDYDDKVQRGQVNATVWNVAGEESKYDSVTVGELPKSFTHSLLQQAKEQTSNAIQTQAGVTQGLLSQYENMLRQEGSNRAAAEKDLMKQLGLIQDITTKNGKKIENQLVTNQEFENRMNSIDSTATDIYNWVHSGNGGVITASPNWQQPDKFIAKNRDGTSMEFSGEGLIFYDSNGQKLKSGLDSNGQMYADAIKGGTIEAVAITACTVNATLQFGDPNSSMQIYIGTLKPNWAVLSPQNGGRVIWLESDKYESMVSSGQMAVRNGYSANETRIHPSYISVKREDNHVITEETIGKYIPKASGVTRSEVYAALGISTSDKIAYTSGNNPVLGDFLKAHVKASALKDNF